MCLGLMVIGAPQICLGYCGLTYESTCIVSCDDAIFEAVNVCCGKSKGAHVTVSKRVDRHQLHINAAGGVLEAVLAAIVFVLGCGRNSHNACHV